MMQMKVKETVQANPQDGRAMGVAAVIQAIPVFVWITAMAFLVGFTGLAVGFHIHDMGDFTDAVLHWILVGMIMACVLVLIRLAWKAHGIYHEAVIKYYERDAAKSNAKRQSAAVKKADLQNEQLQVRIDLEKNLPMVMMYAIQNGHNIIYGKDGLQVVNYLSNVHSIAGQEEMRQLPQPQIDDEKLLMPSIDDMVDAVEPNSGTIALGVNVDTKEIILADIDGVNILVIGRTQMGKSSLVGGLLTQVSRTHDTSHMRMAILDLEDKTGRLFDDDPHILQIRLDGALHKLHARNAEEVSEHLILLAQYMDYRYRKASEYGEAWIEAQPRVMMYFEEFLDWRKTIKSKISRQKYDQVMSSFLTLATRGLKARMFFCVCAQVNYADSELKDAMAQLTGIRISLAVAQRAAMAAGFVETDMLSRVYREGVRGQFLVEKAGGGEIGLAANFDARAMVKALTPKASSLIGQYPDEMAELQSEEEKEKPLEIDLEGDLLEVYEAYMEIAERGEKPSARSVAEYIEGMGKDKVNGLMNQLAAMNYIDR